MSEEGATKPVGGMGEKNVETWARIQRLASGEERIGGLPGDQPTSRPETVYRVWGRNTLEDFLLAAIFVLPAPLIIAFCRRGNDFGVVSGLLCLGPGLLLGRPAGVAQREVVRRWCSSLHQQWS